MFIDIEGNERYKVNLHTHTTRSDGEVDVEECVRVYKNAGYDAIAITDHWKYFDEPEMDGLTLIRGCEYHYGSHDRPEGVFHIVGIGLKEHPDLKYGVSKPQDMVDGILKVGGFPILAHPAWSLDTVDAGLRIKNVYATEIYNTTSDIADVRGYSGAFVDGCAAAGRIYHLIASDDAHMYEDDAAVSAIMVKSRSKSADDLLDAIRAGDYYATTGPEIHIRREGNKIYVRTSPVKKIAFFTNMPFHYIGRVTYSRHGVPVTEAEYAIRQYETYIRAEAYGFDGTTAWSQIIRV